MSQSQSVVFDKLIAILRALRSGRYQVHRGFLDWSTWPFAAYPYAVALWVPVEPDFLASALFPDAPQLDRMIVRMDFATRFVNPTPVDDGAHYAVHQTTLDEIREDAKSAAVSLTQAVDEDGQSIIHRISGSSATEWHDRVAAQQGRIVELTLDY